MLVTRLKVKDESLLGYEYFYRDIPILYKRIMHCHGNHTISHNSNGFILLGNILLIFVVSQNNLTPIRRCNVELIRPFGTKECACCYFIIATKCTIRLGIINI